MQLGEAGSRCWGGASVSIHVLSWVLKNSPTRLADRLVLIVLADHAGHDGGESFPSVATIASEARLSRRKVQDSLRDLAIGKHIVEIGASKYGTTEYRVLMGRKVCAGANEHEKSEKFSETTSQNAPEPSFKPSSKSSNTSSSSTKEKEEQTEAHPEPPAPAGFDRFWEGYGAVRPPRKQDALRAYKKALDRDGSPKILDGLTKWLAYWKQEGTEARFIPHASTWLNKSDYLDDPPTSKPHNLFTDEERESVLAEMRALDPDEISQRKRDNEYPYDDETLRRLGIND